MSSGVHDSTPCEYLSIYKYSHTHADDTTGYIHMYTLRVSHQHCRQACLTQRRCPRQSPLLRCFGFVTGFCPAAGVERACRCPGPSAWPPRRPALMLVPMCVYRHVYIHIYIWLVGSTYSCITCRVYTPARNDLIRLSSVALSRTR